MLVLALCIGLLLLGGLVSAVVIRAAVDMHNRIAAAHLQVAEPKAGEAFSFGLVLTAVVQATTLLVGWLCKTVSESAGWDETKTAILLAVTTLVSIPLVMAGLLRQMLKTTFGRALSITGLYAIVNAVIGIGIGTIVVLSRIIFAIH